MASVTLTVPDAAVPDLAKGLELYATRNAGEADGAFIKRFIMERLTGAYKAYKEAQIIQTARDANPVNINIS